MPTVDQSRVQSGFDVEALLGERYLQMLLQTAYDAAVMPSSAVLGGTRVDLAELNTGRLYEPTPAPDGSLPPSHPEAFETEILFDHPLGAHLKVRAIVQPESSFPIPFDLFLQLGLATEHAEGTLSKVELAAHVVDVDSPALAILAGEPHNMPKEEVLARVQEVVDRTIDLGGTSKFKKVEDFFIEWHQADGEHPSALGVYINVRLRNGDEEDMFVPPRGSLDEGSELPARGRGHGHGLPSRPLQGHVEGRVLADGDPQHGRRDGACAPLQHPQPEEQAHRRRPLDRGGADPAAPLGRRQRCPCRRTASASRSTASTSTRST